MSIRGRTLAIIGLTLLVLTSVLYAFSQLILLEGYLGIEQESVELNVQRAINAVNQKIAFYHNTSVDYAHWDDTYNYMLGLNDDYINDNVMISVFSNYDLDFILFANPAGEIVFSQGYAPDKGELITAGDDLLDYVTTHSALLIPHDEQGAMLTDGVTGMISLPERNVILASTPILRSDESGEPVGVLIWGRSFNDALVSVIGEQTQLSLSLIKSDSAALQGDQRVVVNRVSDLTVTGTAPLYDLEGNPVLLIQADSERRVYQQGQASITYFLVSLVLMSVICAGGIAVMLERTVLSRIANLNAHVSRIRRSSDVTARVMVSGDDEVASLSTNINGMLDSLQTQEKIKLARDNALESARLKAEILANVSHDARTPLSVIILRSELLLNGMYGELNEKQKEVFRQILFNTDQLMSFIENLLEASHLDAGRLQLNVAPFQTAKLLEHARHTLEPLAQEKKLRLDFDLSGDMPDVICGDEKRIDRILTNLVNNAIKFTTRGGVSVRVWRTDAAHWGIEVRDTGVGISKDHQAHIFDAFWQVDGSTTRAASSGVGLGLSIVRQLTELMQGTIQVSSEVGSGSIFTIVLPLHQPVNGIVHEQPAMCTDR